MKKENLLKTYQSYWMSWKGSYKFIPEATTRSDILYLFEGNGIFTSTNQKSGKRQGILISDVCVNAGHFWIIYQQ